METHANTYAAALPLAVELIKRFEGFRAEPYQCPAGVWTIGYGSTGFPNGKPVTSKTQAISPEEGVALVEATLNKFARVIEDGVRIHLTPGQMAALLSLVYNIGPGNFRRSTLLKCLNEGRILNASSEFQKWCLSKGRFIKGLVLRREAERRVFMGEKPHDI